MKTLIFLAVALISFGAQAEPSEGHITMSTLEAEVDADIKSPGTTFSEFSFQYSSVNRGSAFTGVGFMHEWDNGYALGVRGQLPMQFNSDAQIFMAELVNRFMILNQTNQMYIEANLSQAFVNRESGTIPFVLLGASYGFNHHFNNKLSVGAAIGANFSKTRLDERQVNRDVDTFYSNVAVTGGYYF